MAQGKEQRGERLHRWIWVALDGRAAKRAFDLAVAVVLFVLTLPVQVATALAVRIRLGSPVLFKQTRPGLHGEPFVMVKFRTMLPVDPELNRVDDASRMTALGSWLRATSLDELPSLVSIIRGDMSLIGPRPLLVSYLDRYSPEQARRHEVRPGLTGLAQASGRNALSWEEKFRLDVQYVDHVSLIADLRILWATVKTVLRRTGILGSDGATAEFMGTPGAAKDDDAGLAEALRSTSPRAEAGPGRSIPRGQ